MTFYSQSNHRWSVTPELAVLLCRHRTDGAGPLKNLLSFWKRDPSGRLERRWYRLPD